MDSEHNSDWARGQPRSSIPLLASTIHPQVRDVLRRAGVLVGSQMGEAMIRAHKLQLELHQQQQHAYRKLISERSEDIHLPVSHDQSPSETTQRENPNLFSQAAFQVTAKLVQADDESAQVLAQKSPVLSSPQFRTAVLKLAKLPYVAVNRVLLHAARAASVQRLDRTLKSALPIDPTEESSTKRQKTEHQSSDEIDEWIIRNEKYMRARLILDEPAANGDPVHSPDDDVSLLGIDQSSSHWQHFMVRLGRDAAHVFGPSSEPEGHITIVRPPKADLPGLLLLDAHRKDQIKINTLAPFVRRFDSMTGGILDGLDWKNVIVGGGLPLAALTSVTDEEAEKYESSDIDLYLHGLSPEQATTKLQEIEKIYSANLPIDDETGEKIEFVVIRNSQTVTFVPDTYPCRRVQVILKLCPNPMAVMLNFDLDQVGLAYDGTEVWMLPRAARAIITSYTVFTMDLIHGSFLSPRKATQDQRVFKYALRGCGLRFLPSYIAALPQVPLSEATCMDRNVDESSLPRDILHVTLREERARVGWWLAQQANKGYIWGKYFRYSITMRELNSRSGVSPELAERSSLSGWQHFARHVALWEYAQMGYFSCPLREFDFPQVYEADPLCYQDGPQFAWKPGMDLAELRSAAEYYSRAEEDHFEWNVKAFGIQYQAPMAEDTQQGSDTEQRSPHLAPRLTIQRAILGTSLEEAFSKPLVAFVHLPRNFREYAEVTLAQSPSRFADVTLPEAPCHKPNQYRYTAYEEPAAIRESDKEFVLSYWILPGSEDGRLTPYWQLVNRETDEIHEIVHAFRCGHRAISYMSVYERNAETCRHASRRLVRPTERSERDAFKAWACTRAQWYEGNIYEDMASWVVLDVPRWLVFGRLKNEGWGLLNREELPAYAEDMDAGDEIFTDEPTTAAEWIERVRDGNIPEWAKFYRCRLPPVEMLAEIRALAAAR